MKYALLTTLVVTTLFAGVGCQSDSQTAGLEQGLVKPAPLVTQEEAKGPIQRAMPWNWKVFNKKDEAPAPIQYQEPKKESSLAFWNWFKKDPNAPLSEKYILSHLTPELKSRAHTHGDLRILKAKRDNLNARGLHDDLYKVMMWDKPSSLSMYPSP